MNQKPIVLLYDSGVGLIIPHPSGVVYQNQTGGYSCLQDRLEGMFLPLSSEPIDHYEELHRFFVGDKWEGGCARGIDEETADFIDACMARLPGHACIKTDRSCLRDSHEAWVHVTVSNPDSIGLLNVAGPLEAILTWPNSD